MDQATETTKPAAATLPAFGAYIDGQGGYFAGVMRGPTVDGVQQPAIALLVCDAAHEIMTTWGKYREDVPACASRTDGQSNTLAMLNANCPAAMHVRGLTIDGHNDFYLPSIGELNIAGANVPEQFSTDDYYWASTQLSSYDAFVQDFEYGDSHWDVKGIGLRVRAFRRIPLPL